MNPKYRKSLHTTLCLLAAYTIASCSPKPDPSTDTPDLEKAGASLEEKALSFSESRVARAEIIQQFPGHPRSEEVANQLLDAAISEGLVEGEASGESLIYQFPGDNLGLYQFDREYARLDGLSSQQSSAFLQRIQEQVPETPVAYLALGRSLEQTLQESPERFLARCSELLGSNQSEKAARVALHRRIQYYADEGHVKLAGLDALRFWATYPDVVDRMNLQLYLAARVRECGLILESEVLEQSEFADAVAHSTFEEFRGVELSEGTARKSLSLSEAYFQYAPDIEAILEAAPTNKPHSVAQALFFARLGRIAVSQLDGDTSAETYLKYLENIDGLLATDGIDSYSLRHIETVQDTSLDAMFRMLGENGFVKNRIGGSKYTPQSSESYRLLARLSKTSGDISTLVAEKTGDLNSSTYAAIIDEHIQRLYRLNNRKGVTDAYEEFVARFPDSEEAPRHLMMLAKFYDDISGVPTKAQQTYARIIDRYPGSPEAETAELKYGLLLYESEKYEDAFEKLQEFQVKFPESGQVVTAKFLSALCEAAMGLSDEAEDHMRNLIRDHRQHSIAARAMFWLGSASLSQQEYGNARETFMDLMERYPESEYANRASEYVERLSTIAE